MNYGTIIEGLDQLIAGLPQNGRQYLAAHDILATLRTGVLFNKRVAQRWAPNINVELSEPSICAIDEIRDMLSTCTTVLTKDNDVSKIIEFMSLLDEGNYIFPPNSTGL
jgi:hypothetical protein